MRGWVIKRGAVIKSWRRRFMVLKDGGGAIEYGLHPGRKAKGVIRLDPTVKLKDSKALLWSSENGEVEWPSGARETCFCIVTISRTYYLYCDTAAETTQWLNSIHAALEEMKRLQRETDELPFKNPDDPLPEIPDEFEQQDRPLPQLPSKLQSDITDNERIEMWLSQTITRQNAERVLSDAPVGTFLLRNRIDNASEYALSVAGPGGIVQHLKIQHSNGCMVMPSGKQINTLLDLLDHCRHTIDGLSVLLTIPTHAFDLAYEDEEEGDEYATRGGYASVEGTNPFAEDSYDEGQQPRVGYDNLDNSKQLSRPQSLQTDRSSTYSSVYEIPLDDDDDHNKAAVTDHYAPVATPDELLPRREDTVRRPPPHYQNLSESDPSVRQINQNGRNRAVSEPETFDTNTMPQYMMSGGSSAEDILAPAVDAAETIGFSSQQPSKEQLEREAKIQHYLEVLQSSEMHRDQLEIIEIVGEGTFGTISEALLSLSPNNDASSNETAQSPEKANNITSPQHSKLVAVKTLKAAGTQARIDFLNEAAVLKDCDHRNLLGFRGIVTSTEPWQLVVEFVTYGDLRQILKAFRTQNIPVYTGEKLFLAIQIASGMEYLAKKQIIHRDLALRNILLGENCEVKIGDFGLARTLGEDDEYHVVQHRSSMLPIRWMAPETFREKKFTIASDVWAYGVVLWELMTLAKTPWRKEPPRQIMVKVRNGERLECPQDCSREVYHMMKICWFEKPDHRPTFTELQEALTLMYEHDFDDTQLPPRNIGMLILE